MKTDKGLSGLKVQDMSSQAIQSLDKLDPDQVCPLGHELKIVHKVHVERSVEECFL